MKELGIDIETYCSLKLSDCGVYRYASSDDFAILLFAYSIDGAPAVCVDIASGETLPDEIKQALTDAKVVKTAFNAAFERICIGKFLGLSTPLDPAQWQCTMIRAARLGFPLALGQCAEALNLPIEKMKEGKALIRFFSMPSKKGRNLPSDDPERWATFKEYNIRDVDVEQAILRRVRRLDAAPFDAELYIADQEINDRGVLIDRQLVENAARFDREYKAELLERARELTGLENPNSPAQIKEWLHEVTGLTIPSLNKKSLDDIEERLEYWPKAQEALKLRKMLGKTSNMKYSAMLDCVCPDGRIHGLLQFYGASRTGRWAGRLVQIQNLPQNHLKSLDNARYLVKQGDMDDFSLNYDNVTQVLSELIRTAFIAGEGKIFHVCDFSAIEARVIAWLAGEEWVLDVFRKGGDIYCANAARMFGVVVEKHGQNSHLRPKGKIATLALGYGGGVAALEAMGGKRLGLTEEEEKETVSLWRKANPNIVSLWSTLERAAYAAINSPDKEIHANRGLVFCKKWGTLLVTLPSGRRISYPRVRIGHEKNDGWRGDHDIIEYQGLNQTTKKWGPIRTYGGKLTENVVQAIARDILGIVILRARAEKMDVVFHIHDEIIVEAGEGQTLESVEKLFSDPIDWCQDLPLKGAGYSTPYYLKD